VPPEAVNLREKLFPTMTETGSEGLTEILHAAPKDRSGFAVSIKDKKTMNMKNCRHISFFLPLFISSPHVSLIK
jgi:hypothetical protein